MLALEEHGAIDFDKGCYLGQEVVARAQFRGTIKRGLAAFTIDERANVELGRAHETADAKGEVVMVGEQQGLWVTRL
jgi:folate-binding Fe-S cluster repair protein YgfZ